MARILIVVTLFLVLGQYLALGEGEETPKRPNYITEEEFEFARRNPIKVNNDTAHPLQLPPYGEGVRVMNYTS